MKSAYELALERLDSQGIERPRQDSMTDATREEISEARRKAEAKLAELEILYQDKRHTENPQAEEEYQIDRRRIEDERDRKIEQLRKG